MRFYIGRDIALCIYIIWLFSVLGTGKVFLILRLLKIKEAAIHYITLRAGLSLRNWLVWWSINFLHQHHLGEIQGTWILSLKVSNFLSPAFFLLICQVTKESFGEWLVQATSWSCAIRVVREEFGMVSGYYSWQTFKEDVVGGVKWFVRKMLMTKIGLLLLWGLFLESDYIM